MFRPERLTSVSVICLKKDTDNALEALHEFGEFHIEQAADAYSPTEYGKSMNKVEETLSDINELSKLFQPQKTGTFDIFRAEKTSKTQITADNWPSLTELVSQEVSKLKTQAQELAASRARLQEKKTKLRHEQDMLNVMSNMEVDLSVIEEMHLINITVASVPTKDLPDLEKALQGLPLIFRRCYLAKETQFVCSAFPSKYKQAVEKALKTHHGEIFAVPPDLPFDIVKALEEVNKQLKATEKSEEDANVALQKMGAESRSKLDSLFETAKNIHALLLAEQKTLQSRHIATAKGFVPKHKLRLLREKVTSNLEGKVIVLENEVPAAADPPTLIRNSRFVKPFEEITRLYGVPHYDELDPTPIIAVTFPLIFGLMFGDVGHGLVLLVGGLTVGLLIKKPSAIKNMCWILAACGIGAIFAGLLFGEFFGRGLFHPLWFSPFNNVLTFLIFSLFVGIIQIMSGLVLEMIDYLLRHNVIDALLTSLPKMAFYVGGVYLIATYQLNFAAWLAGPILFALVPFLILVFGKTLVLKAANFSLGSVEIPREKISLGERFFESSDLVARLMSNTMSYTRILALLMAHWALILVVYVIVGLVGNASPLAVILGGVIVVAGNVFVIALEGLIVFIHTLRLHFYEWFSKFYQGTGVQFSPFKQNFEHTELILNQKTKTAKA